MATFKQKEWANLISRCLSFLEQQPDVEKIQHLFSNSVFDLPDLQAKGITHYAYVVRAQFGSSGPQDGLIWKPSQGARVAGNGKSMKRYFYYKKDNMHIKKQVFWNIASPQWSWIDYRCATAPAAVDVEEVRSPEGIDVRELIRLAMEENAQVVEVVPEKRVTRVTRKAIPADAAAPESKKELNVAKEEPSVDLAHISSHFYEFAPIFSHQTITNENINSNNNTPHTKKTDHKNSNNKTKQSNCSETAASVLLCNEHPPAHGDPAAFRGASAPASGADRLGGGAHHLSGGYRGQGTSETPLPYPSQSHLYRGMAPHVHLRGEAALDDASDNELGEFSAPLGNQTHNGHHQYQQNQHAAHYGATFYRSPVHSSSDLGSGSLPVSPRSPLSPSAYFDDTEISNQTDFVASFSMGNPDLFGSNPTLMISPPLSPTADFGFSWGQKGRSKGSVTAEESNEMSQTTKKRRNENASFAATAESGMWASPFETAASNIPSFSTASSMFGAAAFNMSSLFTSPMEYLMDMICHSLCTQLIFKRDFFLRTGIDSTVLLETVKEQIVPVDLKEFPGPMMQTFFQWLAELARTTQPVPQHFCLVCGEVGSHNADLHRSFYNKLDKAIVATLQTQRQFNFYEFLKQLLTWLLRNPSQHQAFRDFVAKKLHCPFCAQTNGSHNLERHQKWKDLWGIVFPPLPKKEECATPEEETEKAFEWIVGKNSSSFPFSIPPFLLSLNYFKSFVDCLEVLWKSIYLV